MGLRDGSGVFGAFLPFALILLAACAGLSDETRRPSRVDPMEEKILVLNQQLQDQMSEVQRLAAAVDALTARLKPAGDSRAPREGGVGNAAPQSAKLHAEDELSDGMDADLAGDAAEVPPEKPAARPASAVKREEDVAAVAPPDSSESSESIPDAMDGDTIADSRHENMHFYYRGLQMIEEKRYDEALSSFRDFLKAGPSHVYADRAEFLISKAHLLNKEYGLVIVETNMLEARYPYSFRLADAIFERALAYAGLGQSAEAKRELRELMKRFPRDAAAVAASRKLAELSAPPERAGDAPVMMNDVE